MKKTVTNSGVHNGAVVYLYDGHQVLETRNGSNQVVQQFVHGTQYVDEVVMTRVKDKGDLYVHQDANWNVLATTDPAGRTAERWVYRPYGEFVIHQSSGFGDRDGDGDVDATDKGSVGTTCTGTVSGSCRVLDLDFDGDYDASDATKFDSLPQGLRRSPGRTHSALNQPFAHQGLLFEPEIASYQNRARQYDPGKRRFMQRDPLWVATRPRLIFRDLRSGIFSLFVYLGNNATGMVDPDGKDWCPWIQWVEGCGIGCNLDANQGGSQAQGACLRTFGRPCDGNGPENAWLHCFAACQTTKITHSPSCAGCFWNGREAGNTPDSQMDIGNNNQGINHAEDFPWCGQVCDSLLVNGLLICLDASLNFTSCGY